MCASVLFGIPMDEQKTSNLSTVVSIKLRIPGNTNTTTTTNNNNNNRLDLVLLE